ncbi:MAG: autotransporter assembly complex family protein [Pseudomonadota bacterium]
MHRCRAATVWVVAFFSWFHFASASAEVQFPELPPAIDANLRAYLSLDDLDCSASVADLARARRSAVDEITEALQAVGYYEPSFELDFKQTDSCWLATLELNPGEPVRYRSVSVVLEGDEKTDDRLQTAIASAPKVGAVLHHGEYTSFKRMIQRLLAARGYAEARVSPAELRVVPNERAVDLSMTIRTGPRYKIASVLIDDTVFDAGLIDRLVFLEEGDYFDRAALTRQQQNLQSSALIGSARVDADLQTNDEHTVDVRVAIDPVERIGYFIGAGVSTDRGPRVRGGYRNRRVNSRGHQIDIDLRTSPVLSDFSARYRRPLEDPLVEWASYQLVLSSESTDTSESDAGQLGWERVRILSDDWISTYGVQASQTRFTVAEVRNETTLLMPVIGLSRRAADRPSNPRRGSATDINLRAASSTIISSTDFIQLYVRQRVLYPIGAKGRLRLWGEAGYTWRDDFDELPPEIRFFAGGDNSVRGYDFETIGPRNAEGQVIGGSRLAAASIEYEHDVATAFGIAAFFDIGSAFDGSTPDWQRGTGVGVVWRSPVGPLRAYLAHALDGERGLRLHVSFGGDL